MSSKWLIGGLIASVILNLMLIGFVIGRMTGPEPSGFGPDPTMGYMRVLRELPEARREELMPVLRQHMREMRREVRGTRADRGALFEAMTAEPFDAAALAQALDSLQTRLSTVQSRSHAGFVDLWSRLDASERRALAVAMQRRPPHRHERGGPRAHPDQLPP